MGLENEQRYQRITIKTKEDIKAMQTAKAKEATRNLFSALYKAYLQTQLLLKLLAHQTQRKRTTQRTVRSLSTETH